MSIVLFQKNKLLRITQAFVRQASDSKKLDSISNKVITNDDALEIDKKTHTNQIWDSDDFRLARFIYKKKEINENFAIDLISDVPSKACKERVVSCDGGDESLGHPRVFINLDQPGNHSCGYCGLRFYLDHSHH